MSFQAELIQQINQSIEKYIHAVSSTFRIDEQKLRDLWNQKVETRQPKGKRQCKFMVTPRNGQSPHQCTTGASEGSDYCSKHSKAKKPQEVKKDLKIVTTVVKPVGIPKKDDSDTEEEDEEENEEEETEQEDTEEEEDPSSSEEESEEDESEEDDEN